jgi:hypothetical protein
MFVVVADITAKQSAHRVYFIAGLLVVAGIALLVLTIWFWRSTRPEHPSLAPLEVMGDRGFTKLDEQARLRKMDEVRLPAPGVVAAAAPAPAAMDDLPVADDTVATSCSSSGPIDPLLAQAELDEHPSAEVPVEATVPPDDLEAIVHDGVVDRG